VTSQVQRGGIDTAANHLWSTSGSGCFTSRKDPVSIVQNAEWAGLKGTENSTPPRLDPWNFQPAPVERYPYTDLDKSLGLQQVEAPRISDSRHMHVAGLPFLRYATLLTPKEILC